jgi:hypothetical protein
MTFQDKKMIFESRGLGATHCRRRRDVPRAGLFINGGDEAPPSKALPCVIPGEGLAFFDHAAHLLLHLSHGLVLHGL